MTRRRFVTAAGATGALVAAGGMASAFAATDRSPKPIPGGFASDAGPHIYGPDRGAEPNSMTDFHGIVGVSHVQGPGVGWQNGQQMAPLAFDTDMRFMKGEYIAMDGRRYVGVFGFI